MILLAALTIITMIATTIAAITWIYRTDRSRQAARQQAARQQIRNAIRSIPAAHSGAADAAAARRQIRNY